MSITAEAKAIRQIERSYLKTSRDRLYIACEEYNFTWSEVEIKAFRNMWCEGTPLKQIAVSLKRHVNEVAILIIDQADKGYVKPRHGGVFGFHWECAEDEQSA